MPEIKTRRDRRTMTGTVVGTKMKKTVVVRIETTYRHAKYGKYMRRRKNYFVHDEKEECGIGDVVLIMSCRPLSKLKRWRMISIVQRAPDRGLDVATISAVDESLARGAKAKEAAPEGGGA